jgi:hypothetical protein
MIIIKYYNHYILVKTSVSPIDKEIQQFMNLSPPCVKVRQNSTETVLVPQPVPENILYGITNVSNPLVTFALSL